VSFPGHPGCKPVAFTTQLGRRGGREGCTAVAFLTVAPLLQRLRGTHVVVVGVLTWVGSTTAGYVPAAEQSSYGVAAAARAHGAATTDPARAGIWKAVTPIPGSMHGEFAGHDPIGLVSGVKIPADCSINWVDPDSLKRYCFSSATSLAYFQVAPHTYAARARHFWQSLNPYTP